MVSAFKLKLLPYAVRKSCVTTMLIARARTHTHTQAHAHAHTHTHTHKHKHLIFESFEYFSRNLV